jgi:hypothetical protein
MEHDKVWSILAFLVAAFLIINYFTEYHIAEFKLMGVLVGAVMLVIMGILYADAVNGLKENTGEEK